MWDQNGSIETFEGDRSSDLFGIYIHIIDKNWICGILLEISLNQTNPVPRPTRF